MPMFLELNTERFFYTQAGKENPIAHELGFKFK
jgi:hypothetical protein